MTPESLTFEARCTANGYTYPITTIAAAETSLVWDPWQSVSLSLSLLLSILADREKMNQICTICECVTVGSGELYVEGV